MKLHGELASMVRILGLNCDRSQSLKSLKGDYIGDYMGEHFRGYEGDTLSLELKI